MLYQWITIAAILSTSCSSATPLNLDDIPASGIEAVIASGTTPASEPHKSLNGSKTVSASGPRFSILSSISSERADTGAWDIDAQVYQQGLKKIQPFTRGFSSTFSTHKRGCYSQEKPDYNVTFEITGPWGRLKDPNSGTVYASEPQVRYMLIKALAATLEALSKESTYNVYTNCIGGTGALGNRYGASLDYFCPDDLDVDCGVLTGCGWNSRGGQTVPHCSESCPEAADPNGELGPCFTTKKGLILPTRVDVYIYADGFTTGNEMHITIKTDKVETPQKCSTWMKILYASLNFASGFAADFMKTTVFLACATEE